MMPGPPSRGTKISRLILGFGWIILSQSVMELHGGARNTERGDEDHLVRNQDTNGD